MKMIKRLSVLVLSIVMILSMLPVSAVEEPKIIVSSATATREDSVDITISLKDNPGIAAMKLKVDYPSDLILTNVTFNEDLGGYSLTSEEPFDSPVTLNWFEGSENHAGDLLYATLSFTVSAEATEGDKPISLIASPDNIINIYEEEIGFSIFDGKITVVKCFHLNTTVINKKEATCTETGYTGDTYCADCDEKLSTGEEIDALGHSFTNYVSDGNATCTADGTKTAKCDRCEATDTVTDVDSKLGHDYNAVVTNPTCEEQGYTTHTCSRCKDSYVDSYTAALGHTGGTATCASKAVCTRCQQEYGEFDANNHDGKTEIRDAKAATCTEAGYTGDTYCLSCGVKIATGEQIAKLGHDYTEVVTNPTCKEQGYTTHTCSRCKDSYVDSYTDFADHTPGEWLSDENTHWYICTVCEEKSGEAAHTPGDWIVDLEPTSTASGEKHKECTVCGRLLETEVIQNTHIPGDINGDGSVNNKDLTRLFQYLSDWEVEVNEAALDVNGDSSVNNKDLTRLFQYLSDWDVEIF